MLCTPQKLYAAIRNEIVREIKHAKYFTILADEVTDRSNLEQIAIGGFDGDQHIREEFLDFITVKRTTGESISTVSFLGFKNWTWMLLFGASNMASSNGKDLSSFFISLVFSLSESHVVKACLVPQIRNASGVVSEIDKFF